MYQRIITCYFCLFSLSVAIIPALQAQASDSALTESPGLLWKVSGNGLEAPSFLFGTIHQIERDRFFWPAYTQAAFSRTEQLVLEINISNPLVMVQVLTQGIMQDKQTLRDLLTPSEYQRLETFFEDSVGMALSTMNRLKPMLVSSAMLPKMADGPTTSYEQEFATMAKTQNMGVKGLEKVSDQMDVFDEIPYEEQAQYLIEMVDSFEVQKAQLRIMVDYYVAEDLIGLVNFMAGTGEMEMAGFEEALLVGRNKNWIPKMEKMMHQKPSFFAFGAGHLWGEYGIVQLLREAGYTVESLKKVE